MFPAGEILADKEIGNKKLGSALTNPSPLIPDQIALEGSATVSSTIDNQPHAEASVLVEKDLAPSAKPAQKKGLFWLISIANSTAQSFIWNFFSAFAA